MSIDEHTAIISSLEIVERKTEQKLNATQQEKAKILKKIERLKQQTESRRVHKMIVLGGAVFAEFCRLTQSTDEDIAKILARPDDEMARFARKLVQGFMEHHRQKE